MANPVLIATPREIVGKKVKTLRQNGEMPVVVYGADAKNVNLTVNAKEFGKLLDEAGTSTLIDLTVEGQKTRKVLITDYQYEPMTGVLTHADLHQVKLDEKIEAEVALSFVGESPAVKDLQGNLVTTKDVLRVEAFPQDLIAEIEVDISSLATFDDKITVADVKVPSTLTILDDAEETLAIVSAPRSEEELEAELAETSAEDEAAAVAAAEATAAKPETEEEAAE